MTLILDNSEIAELLPIPDCVERLNETYQELGERRAANRPRSDIYGPIHKNGRYIFKTMDGLVPKYEVAAIRLNSDVIRWNSGPAGIVKEKQPTAPGNTWVGLVLLFSTRTGEPLAIMPDGVMQRLRVACTNALGVRYMTPETTGVYALLGSGWQASGQALAVAAVCRLREIRIYSPTRANRERLAAELGASLGITVVATGDPRTAVAGADIVGAATNSVTPVVELDWLMPHAHVTCVKELELGDGVLEHSKLVVVHTRLDRPANYIVGEDEHPIYAHDPKEGVGDAAKQARATRTRSRIDLTKQPDLAQLVTGKVKLPDVGSMTCFVNTIGMGLQFAALGSLAIERARLRGMGREIPTDWLLQTVHP